MGHHPFAGAPQFGDGGLGAETSLLNSTRDGHLAGGVGRVAGGDDWGGYLAFEGLPVTTHHESAARPRNAYPRSVLDRGCGLAVL
jgi:hypothetical protein